jgi:putative aldouronate transport system permease protein
MVRSSTKISKNERTGLLINEILLFLLAMTMIYPLINTLAVSFSSATSAEAGRVFLWPVNFQWKGWEYVVTAKTLHRSILNSVYITILGTFLSLAFTALFAYPLSKPYFKLRKVLSLLVVFIMVFRYPLIPYFLTIKSFGLLNNLNVLIITHLITPYNMIIMRTFFQNIPIELEEAAFIEGASPLQILIKIYLPLSKAVFATLGLFFAVLYWNLFLHPLLFLQDPELMPIQVQLRQFIALSEIMDEGNMSGVITDNMDINRTTIKAAVVIFGTIPIVMVYPFLQKHFVKGALLGSVKG